MPTRRVADVPPTKVVLTRQNANGVAHVANVAIISVVCARTHYACNADIGQHLPPATCSFLAGATTP
jgi:hypothetical protein